jgi:hypothetical protein
VVIDVELEAQATNVVAHDKSAARTMEMGMDASQLKMSGWRF